jgi:GMP synthase (glutamine-hydrolysing)
VDAVVGRVTRQHKQYNYIWQFPVILAPLSLHGGESIILRPIESREAMTVNFYHMPLKTLREIASQIMQISGIDLLLYDVTNKPPGTIEWE